MSNKHTPTHAHGGSNSAAPTNHTGPQAPRSFETYTDFVLYISQRKCPSCSTAFLTSSSQVEALFQTWLSNKSPINSQIRCRSCSKTTCLACLDRDAHRSVAHNVQGAKVSWCCSRGRLFVIWILLCGFDTKYCAAKWRDRQTTSTERRSGCTDRWPRAGGNGTGYESCDDEYSFDVYGGMFGGGVQRRDHDGAMEKGKMVAGDKERRGDQFHTLVFAFLKVLMPSGEGAESFDKSPPGALVSMLGNSKVLDQAAELLRNDSLDDATKRKDLYMTLVGFLRVIGTHEATKAKAMYGDRIVWPDNVNLLTLSFQGPGTSNNQAGSSLAAGLQNLSIQSEVMLKGAVAARNDFADQQGTDMLRLCRMISELATNLRIGKGTAQQGLATHGIVEVPDDQLWPTYYFVRQARAGTLAPRGRMKRLVMEVTTLKTSLAEGIFVKHAESRLDAMKILIIGPQGTPYEDGLFEFDLFCSDMFPQVPPQMLFKGTSGGFLTINPNLHSDGKVCLSLLGTWPGPKWTTESTILQILISIQAMIFCENPDENEPDVYVNARGRHDTNRRYNTKVRTETAKVAILDWATNPPKLWRDEVSYHFGKNGDRILRNVEQWAREHSRIGTDPELGRLPIDLAVELPKLHQALQKYGATYVPEKLTPMAGQQFGYGGRFGSRYARGGMYGGLRGETRNSGGFGSQFDRGY